MLVATQKRYTTKTLLTAAETLKGLSMARFILAELRRRKSLRKAWGQEPKAM